MLLAANPVPKGQPWVPVSHPGLAGKHSSSELDLNLSGASHRLSSQKHLRVELLLSLIPRSGHKAGSRREVPAAPVNQEHTRLFAATVGSSEAVEEQGSMLGKWLECALGEALSEVYPRVLRM